ncbi:MAG: phenylpropionate dioxygenase-like ring-hydroxylating dioxygenase large terminal subunit [Oceanospirillaceae bacterium]|jgi:phenylpropionate dioxygenase-like ring-hydroxylating dioxygenase large terminal subunit
MFFTAKKQLTHLQNMQSSCESSVPNDQSQPARALPLSSYIDSDIHHLEREKLFAGGWLFTCPADKLTENSSFFACNLAGEPIAIIRAEDGVLRALSNSCRHRGTPLLDAGFGQLKGNISCPYHAWSYNAQGEFKGAPMCGKVTIDAQQHSLPQFAVEVFLGLVFVNFDSQAVPLSQQCEAVNSYAQAFEPERFNKSSLSPAENWQTNWKIIFENAAESYHLFKVHPQTLERSSPTKKTYYVAGNSSFSLTGGELTLGVLDKLWLSGSPKVWQHYLLIALPPSIVMVLNYESLSWININPLDSENSTVNAGYLSVKSMDSENRKEAAFTQAFFAEDKAICERLQQAALSCCNTGGTLVEMEQVLVDFHHYLAKNMFDSSAVTLAKNPAIDSLYNSDK